MRTYRTSRPVADDPLSFTYVDVAAFLERAGRPAMAKLVTGLGESDAAQYGKLMAIKSEYAAALAELASLKGLESGPEHIRYKSEWE